MYFRTWKAGQAVPSSAHIWHNKETATEKTKKKEESKFSLTSACKAEEKERKKKAKSG